MVSGQECLKGADVFNLIGKVNVPFPKTQSLTNASSKGMRETRMMLGLLGIVKSTALQISGEVGAIIALVIAIGIAGVAIILITTRKNR